VTFGLTTVVPAPNMADDVQLVPDALSLPPTINSGLQLCVDAVPRIPDTYFSSCESGPSNYDDCAALDPDDHAGHQYLDDDTDYHYANDLDHESSLPVETRVAGPESFSVRGLSDDEGPEPLSPAALDAAFTRPRRRCCQSYRHVAAVALFLVFSGATALTTRSLSGVFTSCALVFLVASRATAHRMFTAAFQRACGLRVSTLACLSRIARRVCACCRSPSPPLHEPCHATGPPIQGPTQPHADKPQTIPTVLPPLPHTTEPELSPGEPAGVAPASSPKTSETAAPSPSPGDGTAPAPAGPPPA